jgi:hypothetical protein
VAEHCRLAEEIAIWVVEWLGATARLRTHRAFLRCVGVVVVNVVQCREDVE